MRRSRSMKTLQKFSSVHAAFHNHVNQDSRAIRGSIITAETPASLPKPPANLRASP